MFPSSILLASFLSGKNNLSDKTKIQGYAMIKFREMPVNICSSSSRILLVCLMRNYKMKQNHKKGIPTFKIRGYNDSMRE